MSEWYYAKDGRQLGPVTMVSLQQLIAGGSLRPTDLVWREGMGDWAPARTIAGLFSNAPQPAPLAAPHTEAVLEALPVDDDFVGQPISQYAAPAQSAPAQVGYYGAESIMNARAGATLRGFPPPVGPQDEWPLSHRHLEQLGEAVKQRKAIRACSNFFQSLCALYAIGAVICIVAAVVTTASRSGPRMEEGMFFGLCGALVAMAVLAFVARGAVLRCRMWAPVTFLVLFGLGLVMNVVTIAMSDFNSGSFNSRNGGIAPMVGMLTSTLITALFAWPCIRAITAIPKFRALPLWAQEAVVHAKL